MAKQKRALSDGEIEEIEDGLDDWDSFYNELDDEFYDDLYDGTDFEEDDCDSENCLNCESYDGCPNGASFDWDDDWDDDYC